MKKIEMYEANDGKIFKNPIEAEIADSELRLNDLVKSLSNEDCRRDKIRTVQPPN